MKTKIFLLFISFILLVLPIVNSNNEYFQLGGNDTLFELGRGIFGTLTPSETTSFIQGLTDVKSAPLVADLDGDGIAEIYVIDSDNLVVFEGIDLEFQDSFDFGIEQSVSSPIIFDIDGDGIREYIIVEEGEKQILIISFNGTDIIVEAEIDITNANYAGGDSVIGCRGVNSCLIAHAERNGVCNAPVDCNDIFTENFNSTDIITPSGIILAQNGGGAGLNAGFCGSAVPFMAVQDYDKDGTIEYIFTFGAYANDALSGSERQGIHIFWVSINDTTPTGQPVLEQTVFQNARSGGAFDIGGAGGSCETLKLGGEFSSPLVAENLLSLAGFETVLAFQQSTDEYVMFMFEADADFNDDFPETDNSNGILVGNPFIANAFPESDEDQDFCVLGFGFEDNEQVITCGSNFATGFETKEFEYDIVEGFNNTFNGDIYNAAGHSVQHSNVLTDGIDLDEVLSTYGIFRLEEAECNPSLILIKDICDATNIFSNPFGLSFLSSVDIENIGNEDLFGVTETSLFVLDDGISNRQVRDVIVTFNPCANDSILKINTTFSIIVTGIDGNSDVFLENDDLDYFVTLYKDSTNELKQNATNVTSGSPRQFFFIVNKTGASINGEVLVTDNVNDPVTLDFTFTVGINGLEFGDSECTISVSTVEAVAAVGVGLFNISSVAEANQGAQDAIETVSNLFRLSPLVVWLILQIVLSFVVLTGTTIFDQSREFTSNKIFALIFLNIFLFILGVVLGVIPFGVMLVVIIIAGIFIGIWIRKQFTAAQVG